MKRLHNLNSLKKTTLKGKTLNSTADLYIFRSTRAVLKTVEKKKNRKDLSLRAKGKKGERSNIEETPKQTI